MAGLADATVFIEGFCARHGIGSAVMLRLMLVVEELFTNTVAHGHGGDCDAPIRLELSAGTAEVTLLYEDAAPPFDPLAYLAARPPALDAPPADRAVGGLGIHLVEQVAASARYAREDGCNRLWVVLRQER
jgi:anti-sigma regulatory factor (Ser/Thr protein kinase)